MKELTLHGPPPKRCLCAESSIAKRERERESKRQREIRKEREIRKRKRDNERYDKIKRG